MRFFFFLAALLLALTASAWSVTPAQAQYYAADEPFDISFAAYRLERNTPGDHEILVVLTLAPRPGWYAYSVDHTGDVGRPPSLRAELAPGNLALSPYFPSGVEKPDPFKPGKTMRVYAEPTPLFLPLPGGSRPPMRVKARLALALCQGTKCRETKVDLIYPMENVDLAKLPAADEQDWWPAYETAFAAGPVPAGNRVASKTPTFRPNAKPAWNFQPRDANTATEVAGLVTALLFGLLAGLILNIMPCVLPVVSLKLSSLLSAGAGSERDRRAAFRTHNLFFSFGILAYFGVLALILGITGLAWGEIFQIPGLVTFLAALMLALALSLFGIFSLPVVDLKIGLESNSPHAQAFFTGALATLLATPCSGPFLGGVLGWVLLRPPHEISLVFFAIGLGMALPYLLMSTMPALARFFPRPGMWTAYVEKIAAFFLLGTCAYLINILPESHLTRALVLLWCTSVACWLWGLGALTSNRARFYILRGVALVLALLSLIWTFTPRSEIETWEHYTATRFEDRLGQSLLVVDFTADWCPTCKFIEHTVLTDNALREWTAHYNAIFIQVDLTDNNPEGEALLKALGSKSIPLLAIFPNGPNANKPILLRDLFTSDQVEAALKHSTAQE